jgi:hypothetical protein
MRLYIVRGRFSRATFSRALTSVRIDTHTRHKSSHRYTNMHARNVKHE